MLTTTLRHIQACSLFGLAPRCVSSSGYRKLKVHLGPGWGEDDPIPYTTILASIGLDDALRCARAEPQHSMVWRLLAVRYARDVQPANADPRSLAALDVAERYAHGQATDDELDAVRGASTEAAWGAEDAAWASAWAAARATTSGDAAWAAVKVAAWATEAARVAAKGAAWDAATERQTQQFIEAVS